MTNLPDAPYKIGGASPTASPPGIDQAIYNAPRLVGFQLRYRIGPGP